jgi:predicted nucleic acid-binding protein
LIPVQLVVADTSPLHYITLIGHLSIFPALFKRIFIPATVRDEMLRPKTPGMVQHLLLSPPAWLEALPDPVPEMIDPALAELDSGEQTALLLAQLLNATLVLIDDREGVAAAKKKGFIVTGTLGVLSLAARRDLIDLEDAIGRLKATNFRYSNRLIEGLLTSHRKWEEQQ